MNAALRIVLAGWIAGCVISMTATSAVADPLPGERLKFQQLPLDNLTYPVGDPVSGFVNQTYWGHDEFSTAYVQPTAAGFPIYNGRFMADDFADKLDSPIVHLKWWGSYLKSSVDTPLVDKFLISFEQDVPADPSIPGSFSHPGAPLLNQVVTRGARARFGHIYRTGCQSRWTAAERTIVSIQCGIELGKRIP